MGKHDDARAAIAEGVDDYAVSLIPDPPPPEPIEYGDEDDHDYWYSVRHRRWENRCNQWIPKMAYQPYERGRTVGIIDTLDIEDGI